ncbi:MAG: cytochrome c maturation protein CcmE [Candidatus Bathyarchaeia archaeon]
MPLGRDWRTWKREAIEIKRKYTYIIVIVLVVLSGLLAYDAFTSYINPYLTVSQVVENSATYNNKEEIQVIGTVVNGSTRWKEDGSLGFDLADEKYTINVTYSGSLPPGFRGEGEQVVVIGKLVSSNAVESSRMLTKCPSKYEGGGSSLITDPIFLTAILLGPAALIYSVVSVASKRKKSKI